MTKQHNDISNFNPAHLSRRLKDPRTRNKALRGEFGNSPKIMAEKIARVVNRAYNRAQRILSQHELAIRIPGPHPEGHNYGGFGQWQRVPAVSDNGNVAVVDISTGVAYETNVTIPDIHLVTHQTNRGLANTAQPQANGGQLPEGWSMLIDLATKNNSKRDTWHIPESKIIRVIAGLVTCYGNIKPIPDNAEAEKNVFNLNIAECPKDAIDEMLEHDYI